MTDKTKRDHFKNNKEQGSYVLIHDNTLNKQELISITKIPFDNTNLELEYIKQAKINKALRDDINKINKELKDLKEVVEHIYRGLNIR